MADIKDLAALESTLRFIEEKVRPRRCDSDGVSGCWRCQSVYLATRMRELLAERDASAGMVPVAAPMYRKCLYCERDLLSGSECLSKAQSESCEVLAGVDSPDGSKA